MPNAPINPQVMPHIKQSKAEQQSKRVASILPEDLGVLFREVNKVKMKSPIFKIMTPKETAKTAKVSDLTVKDWMRQGLGYCQAGKSVLITGVDLWLWLTNNKSTIPSAPAVLDEMRRRLIKYEAKKIPYQEIFRLEAVFSKALGIGAKTMSIPEAALFSKVSERIVKSWLRHGLDHAGEGDGVWIAPSPLSLWLACREFLSATTPKREGVSVTTSMTPAQVEKTGSTNPYVARAQERASRYGVGKTYLDKEHGWGRYSCEECGFVRNITASVHIDVSGAPGEPPGSLIRRGAQCQQCGKIAELDNMDPVKKYVCECSGPLSNSNPLFCEKCRSTNVNFQTTGMT